MDQLQTVWEIAREELRPQMTGISFHAWVDALEPLSIQNGILVVQVPNETVKNTLREFYLDCLRQAVNRANGSISDVLLVLPEDRYQYMKPAADEPDDLFMLNPKYTFDTFVVGGSNHFAHAAAQAVALKPGEAYNPLFLYGGVGLGKTHLMHAIGHQIREQQPRAKIIYVTSETFTNELIAAIQSDKRVEFRQRYRNVDALLIDDVQFISKSTATQEEFFNTFNTLYNANKQIIISSDRPPKEIPKLEERLCSRFECGLIADIQPPDLETRVAILRNRVRLDHVNVNEDVIRFIAESVHSNIRELEGYLNRVVAYANLKRIPLSLQVAAEALKDLLPQNVKKVVTPQVIISTVACFYSISVDSLLSTRRDQEVVLPRHISMYFCQSLLSLPYNSISELFHRNDHTTAISACKKIAGMMKENATFSAFMEDMRQRILT